MQREDEFETIVTDILAYLERRPMASDSLEGITHWWLMNQSITRNTMLVQRALDHLVDEKLLEKSDDTRSDTVYSLRRFGSSSQS